MSSAILSPQQALVYVEHLRLRMPSLTVAGIAGPGDAFADSARTLETMRLVHERFPDMLMCLSTNGLNAPAHLAEAVTCGLTHLTVTVNAPDAVTGAKVYAWVRDGKRLLRGEDGAALLLERQKQAIRLGHELGSTVKVNAILVPGVNDERIVDIARLAAECGADLFNLIPMLPVADTPFAAIEPPSKDRVKQIRGACERYIKQMYHCGRCRADAVGLLGAEQSDEVNRLLATVASMPSVADRHRPYVAVATREGALVNQHLGEAGSLAVYRYENGEVHLVEVRKTPEPGSGDQRWITLAEQLKDCRALLVSGVGPRPRSILEDRGIRLHEVEGLVEMAVASVFGQGGGIERLQKRCGGGCVKATACEGNGSGCGA